MPTASARRSPRSRPKHRAGVHWRSPPTASRAAMADELRLQTQLSETCRLVADDAGHRPPTAGRSSTRAGADGRRTPGSSPTSSTTCATLQGQGRRHVVVHPIGFLSDHMEVLYDLDEEARHLCEELGLNMVRSRHGRHAPGVRADAPRADRRAVSHCSDDERRASASSAPATTTAPSIAACLRRRCPLGCRAASRA